MTEQTALGYAIGLEARGYAAEASELRRLHAENELLGRACDKIRLMHRDEIRPLLNVHTVNSELLEALKQALEECIWPNERLSDVYDKARTAIAKAQASE